jgi:hypothetical protein
MKKEINNFLTNCRESSYRRRFGGEIIVSSSSSFNKRFFVDDCGRTTRGWIIILSF